MKVNLTVIQYKNLFNINKNLKTISTDISTSKRTVLDLYVLKDLENFIIGINLI